jgi:hypothetical protein
VVTLKLLILCALLLACCFGDVVTSYVCVTQEGKEELNQLMEPFVENPVNFFIIKLFYIFTVVVIAYYLKIKIWLPLGTLFVWWSLVLQLSCVFQNIWQIIE